jgi:transposase
MARKKYTESVSVFNPICCGLDVHKDKISSCIISDNEGEASIELAEFGGFTEDIVKLKEWLLEKQCPIVAMESTGIYWRPIYNVLEGSVKVILVNARHFKNVPGRKTDVGDSQWLADLLRYGLVKGSFIPPLEVRQWRDLTTMRKHYVKTESDFRRRTQKLFESANIKIDSVASDIFGVSGRNLMELLLSIPTEDITRKDVIECLRGQLTKKSDDFFKAVKGFFTDHHRSMLRKYLDTIDHCRTVIQDIDNQLAEVMKDEQEVLKRLQKVPGIAFVSAVTILSFIGTSLKNFPNAAALCCWAGVCPGNNESAGKRKNGRSPVYNHPLKTLLVEVAWAAIKVKDSYYKEKYYRLKARRGAKRAIVAIAHKILKAIYYIIKDGAEFKELGSEYLLKRNQKITLVRLRKQAQKLGFELTPKAA